MIRFFILITSLCFLLTGCQPSQSNDKSEKSNNEVENSSSISDNTTSISQIQTTENISNISNAISSDVNNVTNENTNTSNTTTSSSSDSSPKETELASFTTKIYTKEEARQNNLSITSSRLNGTIVKAGSTFSFTQTIGPSTSNKGYQEADIFDSNGNKKKGLGGGNCQISSTLYNVVLSLPTLTVIERHEHSNKVPYVKAGKDAAVAYGSIDFKFKNENPYDIKIYSNVTTNNVTVRIVKIE